jgi:hypothetical protein
MRIFISWSGKRSRDIASALKDWLPLVLHFTEPWMSDADIHAGQRWSSEIGKSLEESNIGVLCITRDNLVAPWLLFEAGALSKSLKEGAVLPYLLDVQFADINNSPIGQFQAKKADKQGTSELVSSINSLSPSPIPGERLDKLFERFWPDLEDALAQVGKEQVEQRPVRSQAEILEELVSAVRNVENRLGGIEHALPWSETTSPVKPIEVRNTLDLQDGIPRPRSAKIRGSGNPIMLIATTFRLDPAEFAKSWFTIDMHSKPITVENMSDLDARLSNLPRVITLSDLPF